MKVVLTHTKSGRKFRMEESNADAIMKNPLIGNLYTKGNVPETPEEVLEFQQQQAAAKALPKTARKKKNPKPDENNQTKN